jgi:AraC-like DNA-binding protein
MRYREVPPPAALRQLVHRFWILQGDAGPNADFQRAMPDGRPEIIFNLADRFESRSEAGGRLQSAALLVGPTTRAMELRPTGRIDLAGLRLQPGAAPALLGLSGRELVDRAMELAVLDVAWARDLPERLAESDRTSDRLDLMERSLLGARERWRGDLRLEAGIGLVLRARGPVRVGRIAAGVGISPRHLSRLCRERAGIGPKLLGRLARFQRVLRELEQDRPPRWAALAHRHGYFDQAHLAGDFRRFAGVSPGRYLLAQREVTRHFIEQEIAER